MKKLILVTALAVAASWLLSEPGHPGDETATQVEIQRLDGAITEHLAPLPRVHVLDEERTIQAPLPPVPPLPPEPPSPPSSIRTIPWNKRATASSEEPRWSKIPPKHAGHAPRKAPSWFPKEDEELSKARPDASGSRVILGRLSASEDRARRDLRATVEREVSSWLAADVPPSWKPAARLIDGMIQSSYVQAVVKDLAADDARDAATAGSILNGGEPEAIAPAEPRPDDEGLYTLYRAGQKLDFSPARRAEFVGEYRRELAAVRLQRLVGGVALALAALAVVSGYIRADEATKGYYTNRLRLLAAGGLGAAGVAAYRFLA